MLGRLQPRGFLPSGLSIWLIGTSPAAAANIAMLAILALLFWPGSDLLIVAILPSLVIFLRNENSISSFILGSAFVYWLGEISYSVYVVHRLIESAFEKPLQAALPASSQILPGLAMAALTLGLATLTYYGIERPCRKLSRGLLESFS